MGLRVCTLAAASLMLLVRLSAAIPVGVGKEGRGETLGAVGREAARAAQEKARAARRAQREVVPKWMEAPLDVAAFPAALPVAALPLSPALLGNFAHETLFPVQATVRPA